MNKHTQGQWNVDALGNVVHRYETKTDSYSMDIALIADTPRSFGKPDKGNAQLIAAAPELLEACIEALRQLNATDCPVIPDGAMVRARLYSAIKKAKGE